MPALNLSEISSPLTKGDLAYIRAFQESDTGVKLEWQLREAMPLDNMDKLKGWRDCLTFYAGIARQNRGQDNQPAE